MTPVDKAYGSGTKDTIIHDACLMCNMESLQYDGLVLEVSLDRW